MAIDFKMKKSLGQNFLQDQNIINKIANIADVNSDDNVLEIGSGKGALTSKLIEKANKVLSVEIDGRLIEYLENKYQSNHNFKLLNKDFLKTNISDFNFIDEEKKNKKVIANLPYYITTPIILKILLEYDFIDEIYVMVQKEVALRFTSEYRKKTYGSISVFLQSIAKMKYEFTVKNTVFKPVPKIDSAIISLKLRSDKKRQIDDYNDYEFFLKACFSQKRKILVNNLSKCYNISKDKINVFLNNCEFNDKIRPEEITVDEYIIMYLKWKEYVKEIK